MQKTFVLSCQFCHNTLSKVLIDPALSNLEPSREGYLQSDLILWNIICLFPVTLPIRNVTHTGSSSENWKTSHIYWSCWETYLRGTIHCLMILLEEKKQAFVCNHILSTFKELSINFNTEKDISFSKVISYLKNYSLPRQILYLDWISMILDLHEYGDINQRFSRI